jgi:DNA-binding NarL/FixJ family response regulator
MRRIRVLVADDHTIVRQGLVSLLAASPECEIVGEAADGVEAVEKAIATRPDVVVMDLTMPRLSGIEAVRRVVAALPRARVLVLTVHSEEEYVLQAVRAGAAGYLVKDSAASELLAAVRALDGGRSWYGPQAGKALAEETRGKTGRGADPYGALTPREREVFHLVVEGCTTKQIAVRLGISAKTAENHRSRVLDKLDVRSTAELIRYAAHKGLL